MLAAEEFMVSVITLEKCVSLSNTGGRSSPEPDNITRFFVCLSLLSTNILQFIFIPKHHG